MTMIIIYELVLSESEITHRFIDMAMAHQYMLQLMKNSIGFEYNERDVKADSVAYTSILSKQEKLCKLATGKLPFNTKVSNKSRPKVNQVKEKQEVNQVKEKQKVKQVKEKQEVKQVKEKQEVKQVKEEPVKKEPVKEEPVKEQVDTITIIETKTPTGCTYKMMRGERRRESCNKPCSKDSSFCKTHK